MRIISIYLKNFRCFPEQYIELDNPLVLIEGLNGSGKTSLLEAIHYLCYLRSFKTQSPRDLLHFGQENFFLKAAIRSNLSESESILHHELQVGYSDRKRLVKIDQKAIVSYKELMDYYRVITITADDNELITGGPEVRRTFIDQALLLTDPTSASHIRMLKHVIGSRNALLQEGKHDPQSLEIWTHKVWNQSAIVRAMRISLLTTLETEALRLLSSLDETLRVSFSYTPKHIDTTLTFEQFKHASRSLFIEETLCRRSLFGAHLDDFSITIQSNLAKQFASRGQQKLVVLLLKIAQVTHLMTQRGSVVFLLDDFITDFDDRRCLQLLSPLIALGGQLIFTTPSQGGILQGHVTERAGRIISLD